MQQMILEVWTIKDARNPIGMMHSGIGKEGIAGTGETVIGYWLEKGFQNIILREDVVLVTALEGTNFFIQICVEGAKAQEKTTITFSGGRLGEIVKILIGHVTPAFVPPKVMKLENLKSRKTDAKVKDAGASVEHQKIIH